MDTVASLLQIPAQKRSQIQVALNDLNAELCRELGRKFSICLSRIVVSDAHRETGTLSTVGYRSCTNGTLSEPFCEFCN